MAGQRLNLNIPPLTYREKKRPKIDPALYLALKSKKLERALLSRF